MMVAAFVFAKLDRAGDLKVIFGVLGFKATLVGIILAAVYHVRVAGRYDRLRRGEGVLIRWKISPERWNVSRNAMNALAQVTGSLQNELKLPQEIPPQGIDVVVSRDAFMVGPEFEILEKNAAVRGVGPVLEIEQTVPINRFQTRRAVYRLPMLEHAEAEVSRLAHRYREQAVHVKSQVRTFAILALIVIIAVLGWVVVQAV